MSTTETTPGEADVETVVETDDAREGILTELGAAIGDSLLASHLLPGKDLWVRVDAEAWRSIGEIARDQMGFSYFCFLSAIDWMPSPFGRSMDSDVDTFLGGAADVEGAEEATDEEMTSGYAGGSSRFQVLARLYSIERKLGFTLKADLDDAAPSIASWVNVFGGANWHEREAFEMFGINFEGHPALRNIYLPGDFEGNPLRKDFPLLSRHVKPWPGIVDVEGMPDEDGPDGDDNAEGSAE